MKKSQRKFAYDDSVFRNHDYAIHEEATGFEVPVVEDDIEEEEEESEVDEELEDEWDGDDELISNEADSSDDPVRTYLVQMGQIPLLSRQQEVTAAKKIEKARNHYRYWMLSTDFMLQGATKLLEQVRDGKLRLDRTIEVSVTNAVEKRGDHATDRSKHPDAASLAPSQPWRFLCRHQQVSRHQTRKRSLEAFGSSPQQSGTIGRGNELANQSVAADVRKARSHLGSHATA